MHSLLQVRCALAGGVHNAVQESVFGRRVLERIGFGADLRHFAEVGLSGCVTASQLHLHHSHFGIYSKLLAPSEVGAVLRSLDRGERFHFRGCFPGASRGELLSRAVRFCQLCVEDDQDEYGFAYWRVHHNLSFAKHCLRHGIELSTSCNGTCRASPIDKLALFPGQRCSVCSGCSSDSSRLRTRGYDALMQLSSDAMLGVSTGISPTSRGQSFASLKATGDVTELLLEAWDCENTEELGGLLGCQVQERSIDAALVGGEMSCHPNLLFALSALARLEAKEGSKPELPDAQAGASSSEEAELFAAAAKLGFPELGIRLLIAGRSSSYLETRKIASKYRVAGFLASLTPSLRARMESSQENRRNDSCTEALRSRHRDCARRFLEQGGRKRSDFSAQHPGPYWWLVTHDRAWLDVCMPARLRRKRGACH